MKKDSKPNESEDTRTYLIVLENGVKQKITVPSNWKVTFGPAVPGLNKESARGRVPTAIRFYEDENRQRAIFTDVVSFRDLSIPFLEERRSTRTKLGRMEVEGAIQNVNLTAETRKWVDPEKEPAEPMKLLREAGFRGINIDED